MEELNDNLLFRWFVDVMTRSGSPSSTFTKNR